MYFSLFLAFSVQICYNISVGTVQKISLNIFRITLAVAVTLVATLLFGCGDDVDIALLRTDITLAVGERRNILPYVGFSADGDNIIELSADSDCVETNGTFVTAIKAGTANVIVSAHGKTAVMNITVAYRAAQDFFVTAENAVQTVAQGDKILPAVFSVEFDSYVNPQTVAQWEANGTSFEGNRFEYTPQGYGEYTVSATVGDVNKQCTVKVYRRTDISVKHTDISNVKAFSPIVFTAYENADTLNPISVYEWRVNGEVKSDNPLFEFTPTGGQYAVSLFVNGERKKIDGKDELVFAVVDDTAVDCKVEYDDEGGVYVRFSHERKVLYVSIINPTNRRYTFDVTDAQYAHLFGDGYFRATDYIEICAQNPAVYTVIIGTDGGRHELKFTQLGMQAKSYLDDKVLCKNSFVSSEDDAREWVRELYAVGETTAKCYAESGAESIERAVREQAEMLGLSLATIKDGNILTITFAPYINKPTKYESKSANTVYAQLPHIEYSDNRRTTDYVFMSDRPQVGVNVRGSEQLLIAVSSGVRPITKQGDIADSIYRAAKSILLRIMGADYAGRQKVHAIYDWLQWATVNVQSVDADSASMFLEGVFASSRENGCVVTSEGAAKAFALLCGMEGIECVTEFDSAYGYYNKVRLNDLWYNVDVYGGKIKITGEASSSVAAVELTSHRGLLISDEQHKALGCNASGIEAFDGTNTEYAVKHSAYGTYFDYYITERELNYDAVRAIVFLAFDGTVRGNTQLPHVGSEVHIYNNTYGVELELDKSLTDEQIITVNTYINRAIDEYAKDVLSNATFASRRIIGADNIIVAIAESPRTGV